MVPLARMAQVRALAALIGGLFVLFTSVGTAPAQTVQRVALVIGNGAYRSVPVLGNSANDARAMAAALAQLEFHTELLLDGDKDAMQAAFHRLASAAQGAEAAVLFYAGHASEVGGHNLLIPVSASARNVAELKRSAVSFDDMLGALNGKASTTLIFLDACRDNPFAQIGTTGETGQLESSRGITRSIGGGGLASVTSSAGMLIAFSTAPGQVALDGNADHSPFTAALLRHIGSTGVEVRQMLSEVRRDVRESTLGRQTPWDNSSLEGDFFFRPRGNTKPSPFDGTWQTSGNGWNISAVILNGHFSGKVTACFRPSTGEWNVKAAFLEGDIDSNGELHAKTVNPGSGYMRDFVGRFPNVQIKNETSVPQLCPEVNLTFQRALSDR
jgi:hypothetical protein